MKITHRALLAAAVFFAGGAAMAAPLELGALFEFTGTGASAGISGSIFDKDIHSGSFRSANGTSSDSYVLQGGDPFGGDTGDAFEESQAHGHATVNGFGIETGYASGQPAVQAGTFITANPDTGFLIFTNTTLSTFTGILKISGHAFGGIYGPEQDFSNSGSVSLLPGEGIAIVLNEESSNFGGYNHPDVCGNCGGVPEPGSLALLGLGAFGLGFGRRRLR